jgi:UDP-glucose 4-epimerase
MTQKILITGVGGLLGSRLADWILANKPGVEVIGVDDFSGGYVENVDSRVKLFIMDLGKESAESIFIQHQPDIVYHFAAYAAEALSPFIRQYNYVNNLLATAGIVNNCIKYGVKRLVFTSSMGVYGFGANNPPFHEDMARAPIDPYGIAKAACEQDIGLDWCIIRPHNVFGAKQNIWDSYRNVLGIWMYKHLTGQPLTIFGDGNQVRAFSCIDDSLEPLWRAGTDPKASKQIINLGGIKEYSINEAADTLAEIMGGSAIQHLPPRHEVKYAYPTWQKSVDILGFEHKTDLYEGLKLMWDWARVQPERPRQVWGKYEVEQGIYPFWKTDVLVTEAKTALLKN